MVFFGTVAFEEDDDDEEEDDDDDDPAVVATLGSGGLEVDVEGDAEVVGGFVTRFSALDASLSPSSTSILST